ncbi:MAG: sulfatase [Planctomycetota bacterium]
MSRYASRFFLSWICLGVVAWGGPADAVDRPNILWITIEDWSPDLSCYGTAGIQTPNVDRLAGQGIRYERAFTTSPVCSTSRSAMMTGFHQNYIGAHQHRTSEKKALPFGIRPIPHLMADAGYYTCLLSHKTDCNFLPDSRSELFDGRDWKDRGAGQPFFARVTLGGTHRPWKRDPVRPIAIEDVQLPPYYPDTDFIRRDWANGLEQMQLVDREVGELLKRLDEEGIAENTLVIFVSDHGRCHIRGKQFLYDEGTRVPLVLRWPGRLEPGQVNDDLVMAIDLAATVLDVAGVEPPVPLHGISLFDDTLKDREYVFAARDKMGETHDAMRSIRSKKYKLIQNLMPERAYCQFSGYKEGAYPPLAELNVLHQQGRLSPEQASFMASSKSAIELFDLEDDPHEIRNVADDAQYADVRRLLLKELARWRSDVIHDAGVSEDFRAPSIYPARCPTATVGQWVQQHVNEYDYLTHGVPGWYPTRTLVEWQRVRSLWEPWVFRDPTSMMKRPAIPFTKKPVKKAG